MTSACRHCQSRHRRIGSTMSARSSDPLQRSRMIDDRRIHFENGERADFPRSENPFAAEVVITLDDDIGPNLRAHDGDITRAKQPKPPVAERRRQRKPLRVAGRESAAVARRHEHVNVVPQCRESFGNGRHVHRSAMCGRHRLIDGRVQNLHHYVVSGFSRTSRFAGLRSAGPFHQQREERPRSHPPEAASRRA